jgi:signal transduction histidine kinase
MQETMQATSGISDNDGIRFNPGTGNPSNDRKRVETIVRTLSALGSRSESIAEVAHDARNMLAALNLYCDLLDEPGVLAVPFLHYGQELRLVAAASQRLVEKLVTLDHHRAELAAEPPDSGGGSDRAPTDATVQLNTGHVIGRSVDFSPTRSGVRRDEQDLHSGGPIPNLAAELISNRNLLSALAGPAIAVTVHAASGAQPVLLAAEDLTRVLVNLVKNAAEAMPKGGRIHLELTERPAATGIAESVTLVIEDNGPGTSAEALGAVFNAGFTTRSGSLKEKCEGPLFHRGLGLAITRSIVEGAGGRIGATNREPHGMRIEIELPVRKSGYQP